MRHLSLLLLATSIFLCACEGRGTKMTFDQSEFFYTSKVDAKTGQAAGKFLNEDIDFFDGADLTIQLDKVGPRYRLNMVSKDNAENKLEYVNGAKALCRALSEEVLNNAEVDFHFCDWQMVSKKALAFEFIGIKKVLDDNIVLYEDPQTSPSNVLIVNTLRDHKLISKGQTVRIKTEQGLSQVYIVDQMNMHLDEAKTAALKALQDSTNQTVQNKIMYKFIFCDFNFNPL
jgi:hypothetical protein